jgi:hypothetical protein
MTKHITEAEPDLKKTVVSLIKSTDNETLLKRVLHILKAGNIDERVVDSFKADAEGSKFAEKIAQIVVSMDFPIEDKNAFLERYSKGIIDTRKLLDGRPHNFLELVGGQPFAKELFKILATNMVSQGVGPGEVALAVLSPQIKWVGQSGGGGDVIVGKTAVEVKTSVAKGGRWINPRKAKMDLAGVIATIEAATQIATWPARINPTTWVNQVIPAIMRVNPKQLRTVCSKVGSKIFTNVNTTAYTNALASGDVAAIQDEHLRTGFENYKVVSGFDGMLIMDVGTETAQYFKDYDSMKGKVKAETMYIYAPEGEIMPQVTLMPVSGISAQKPKAVKAPSAPAAPVPEPKAPGTSMSADRVGRPGKLKFQEPTAEPIMRAKRT